MPEPARKQKVFWTEEEKALLCAEAARLLYTLTASTRLMALHQAQEKLPANRRRKLLALTGLTWFTDGAQRELELLRAAVALEAEPAAPAHPNPETLGLEALYPLVRKRLVSELAAFISDVLQEVRWPVGLPLDTVAAAGGAVLRKVLAPVPTQPRLPAVLVVGLRGGQMDEIRREHGKKLDLRFVGSDENKEKLRFMSEQADFAVAMTDFISHSHEDILAKRAKKYLRSAGGLTRLKELLHGLESSPLLAAAA